MIVGHGAVSFILATLTGKRWGSKENILIIGGISALMSYLPDLDLIYALIGFLLSVNAKNNDFLSIFWQSASLHRTITHSLDFISVTSFIFLCFFLYLEKEENYFLILFFVVSLILCLIGVLLVSFLIFPLFMVYLFFGIVLTKKLYSRTNCSRKMFIFILGTIHIHPFFDFFTGEPPNIIYPFSMENNRVVIFSDDTLNLLSVTLIEVLLLVVATYLLANYINGKIKYRQLWPSLFGVFSFVYLLFFKFHPTLENSVSFILTIICLSILSLIIFYLYNMNKNFNLTNIAPLYCIIFSTTLLIGVISYIFIYISVSVV